MAKYFVGIVGALLGVLAGIWLIVAPFALAYQNGGQDWADPTYVDFWTGMGLVVISMVGVISYASGLTGELRSRGIIERGSGYQARSAGAPERGGDSRSELEQTLLPLAEAMLQDMQEQHDKEEAERNGEQHNNDAGNRLSAGSERRQRQ